MANRREMPDDVKRRCAELRAAGKPWADIAAGLLRRRKGVPVASLF
jgi:hypothetical protein